MERAAILILLISFAFTAQAKDGVLKEDFVSGVKDFYPLSCKGGTFRSWFPSITKSQCEETMSDVADACLQLHVQQMPTVLHRDKESEKWSETSDFTYWNNVVSGCIVEKYLQVHKSAYVPPG